MNTLNFYTNELKTPLEFIVSSHLSDVQIEMSLNPEMAKLRIRFVKFLIDFTDGDLSLRLDVEKLWADWAAKWNIQIPA